MPSYIPPLLFCCWLHKKHTYLPLIRLQSVLSCISPTQLLSQYHSHSHFPMLGWKKNLSHYFKGWTIRTRWIIFYVIVDLFILGTFQRQVDFFSLNKWCAFRNIHITYASHIQHYLISNYYCVKSFVKRIHLFFPNPLQKKKALLILYSICSYSSGLMSLLAIIGLAFIIIISLHMQFCLGISLKLP